MSDTSSGGAPVPAAEQRPRTWFRQVSGDTPPPIPRRVPKTVRLGVEESLEPKVVPFWLVSSVIGTGFLAVLATLVFLGFRDKLPGDDSNWIVGLSVLLGLLLIWGLIQAPLAFKRWRYSVDGQLLRARYGVIVHEEKIIPISRMQHVDLVRGPVERMFGLATLIVFTAGTDNSSFRVPGLRPERAEGLRDHILATRGDDVV